jgi:cysteine desulfurase
VTRRPIYLDHHATTPVDPRVVEAMAPYWTEEFGNASSATHVYGWRAEAAVEQAREELAAAIGAADPREIVFTSGTTEADNLALAGIARAQRGRRDQLVTCAIEHPAVLDTARALAEHEGCSLTELPVGEGGLVAPDAVRDALGPRTALVSIAAANSEIGVLQPIAEIASVCHEVGVPFHSDAAQAVGKVPIDVRRDGVDLLSFCAHKLYGPKGIGALYVRRGGRPPLKLEPLLLGGGHERGLRSGTTPVPLVVGFARAVSLCLADREAEAARQGALRDRLFEGLCRALPGQVERNGDPVRRLPGNLNVSFAGVRSEALLSALHDVALSSGSACASARGEPSHVLRALGLPPERVRGALRFGLGRGTTEAEIDTVIARVAEEVQKAQGATAGPRRLRNT